MAFRGLFIGIDRYASSEVDPLSCARRDAVALRALFADTFGGDPKLLVDEHATREAITREFEALQSSDQDDVVVITFSGHGSSTHELVTYDAKRDDLSGTCLSLDLLTDWFSKIPARTLLCVMDCCFSGGMGAKVLYAPEQERSLPSAADRLEQMSGDGRLIFTASSATEPAWEDVRRGHGFLTLHLIDALLGADEVIRNGKISVLRLLEHVTRRVTASASERRRPQHPAIRGQIDGDLAWPVFVRGPAYLEAFPDHSAAKATQDVASLAGFGFPPALISAWAGAIPSLNDLQLDAINSFALLQGEHLVVSAPTSSGKTLIGELAALKAAVDHKRSFFLLPLKALVNDKYSQFVRIYGPLGIRTVRATGDTSLDVSAIMRGRYDICLMTYEKFAALILGNPHIVEQVGTVVIDEVQMLADSSRGVNLEFIMTLLKIARRRGIEPQIVSLSAVIGDTNGLEQWLSARLLRRDERPVPLDEGIIRADGSLRKISSLTGQESVVPGFIRRMHLKESSQDWVIPLVRRLTNEGKQVIVFRETRAEARMCALYLARELGLPPAANAVADLPTGDPSAASLQLRQALGGGVAFHISDLAADERRTVEEHYRAKESPVRIIVATTTLAMGINMPAAAVVVVGLVHPGKPPTPYSVAEYKNIVGRAGRLGYADRGESYLIALLPMEEHSFWNGYVLGVPENLDSQFLAKGTDPRSVILRVLATAQQSTDEGMQIEELIDFLESSLGAFQLQQSTPTWRWDHELLLKTVSELLQHKLMAQTPSGGLRLTELGRLAGESGIEARSIIRLVDALSRLAPSSVTDQALIAVAQLTVELDKLLFPINAVSTTKEPQAWPEELRKQGIAQSLLSQMTNTASDRNEATLRAKKAVGALLWISDLPMADIERILTQFGRRDGAAGAIRGLTSRLVDVLPTTARIAELIHPGLDLGERCSRLLIRLDHGIPGSAVDVARWVGTALGRGDYLKLIAANLSSMDAIDGASDTEIAVCIGTDKDKLLAIRNAADIRRNSVGDGTVLADIPLYEA